MEMWNSCTQVTVLIGSSDVNQQMLLSLVCSDELFTSHPTKQVLACPNGRFALKPDALM